MTTRRTRKNAALAGAAALALVLSACSGDSSPASSDAPTVNTEDPITLSFTMFSQMGFDESIEKFEAEHPNITVETTKIATGNEALLDWQTKQAAGSGLPDIQTVEEGWISKVMQVSDTFENLSDYGADDIKDRWVPWKVEQVTDPDGRFLGYGTDIGPTGMCYNNKLMEEAGMASEREEFAELLGGENATWEQYFEVGREYYEKTGKAWFDQSGSNWTSMVNQLDEGYYTADGELNVKDNQELKDMWLLMAEGAQGGLSSNQTQWDWGGGQAFVDGSFATFICPGWMLGVVKGQVEAGGGDADSGWDFADVFPGGPVNWGGSFLMVPSTSEHPAEAAMLAEYLTAAPQQVAAFVEAGTFPSVIEAQQDPGVTGSSELTEFFNDSPVGEILANRADGVVAQYKGPDESVIQAQVFGASIQEIDSGKADGPTSWDNAMDLYDTVIE